MTGYGSSEGELNGGRLAIEVRTVNHRHFNAQLRVPLALQRHENDLRNRLKQRLDRGHIALQARWTVEPERPSALRVDIERAKAVVAALRELQQVLGVGGEIDLGFVARQPEVLSIASDEDLAVSLDALLDLVDRAVAGVVEMREREGAALTRELAEHLAFLEARLREIEARAPERVAEERTRLQRAVGELLEGRALDDGRLEQEIAILADRLDIHEEAVRLATHIGAARAALDERGPVGRQLGFLGQEMLREINTIGSKASDAAIAQAVIAMKTELEKFREQVENIE